MERKTRTQIFEDIHRYAIAAERLRVLATPTAIEIVRLLILAGTDPSKLDLTGAEIYDDRSMRRTLRRMAKVGLVRWEPWNTGKNRVYLTSAAKKILRAAGAGV